MNSKIGRSLILARSLKKQLLSALAVSILAAAASATTLYVTSITQSEILSVDSVTGTQNLVLVTPSGPDSLVFTAGGAIIYSEPAVGQVRMYDPNTHSDTLLASGFTSGSDLAGVHDLALVPGGGSVLVSDTGDFSIYRIDLNTHLKTRFASFVSGSPEGLAFDNAGRLFANLFSGSIVQLNPTTGAIIQQSSSSFGGLDGLTFDPVTGRLFAASLDTDRLYSFDPANLTHVPSFVMTPKPPDGVSSDGAGNIFVAGTGSGTGNGTVYSYSLTTGTFTTVSNVTGLDDVAPLVGPGAPSTPAPICGTTWQTNGPRPPVSPAQEIGYSIAINPVVTSTVYAGTSDGVFKSTNSGGSWVASSTGFPTDTGTYRTVLSLAHDPQALTPGIIYAGIDAGNGGTQLYKSIDGGATWNPIGLPASTGSVSAIALDPTPVGDPANLRTIYVGTFAGVWKSTDGGATFTQVFASQFINALGLAPSLPTTLYAGTLGNGVYKSIDGGATWNQVSNGLPNQSGFYSGIRGLAVVPTDPNTVYAAILGGGSAAGGIYKTTDGGATWTAMNNGINDQTTDTVAIDPQNPMTVYAGAQSLGVFKSTDAGMTWSPFNNGLTNNNVQSFAIDPINTTQLYAGTSADGVFQTVPCGTNLCANVTCPAPDQCHTQGTCDPSTGMCSNPSKPNGTSCDDGNACTTGDVCTDGSCGGTAVTCAAADQCHNAGVCDGQTGTCSYAPKADGTTCNDGNACTQTDSCQNGTCTGSNPVTCTASDQCHAAGTCDPTSGGCSNPAKADGSTCNDGNTSTYNDHCDGAGACTGTPVTCAANTACVSYTPNGTATCTATPKPNGTACNDGNACTQTDTCQSGSCVGANPVTCAASDQCHDVGTCNPANGTCSNPAKTNGSACNDGNACTQTDTCQSGTCTGSNPVTCTASDQCHDVGTCNPASGVCSNPTQPNGTVCNDGNACTQTDTCQSGVCTGSNPVTCTASDQCHSAGTCDSETGVCSNPSKANGTACDDGNACTQTDTCQSGSCVGATPVTCTASDQCHDVGTCNPATGTCSNPAKANGTLCNDGDACTQNDMCQGGVCTAGQNVCGACQLAASISANFNGTAIGHGNYIWFNSVLKPSGLGSTPVTIRFTNQMLTSSAFYMPIPDSQVTFDPTATTATTTFTGGMWVTRVPSSGLAGNTFLSGFGYLVPNNIPGGLKNVTWSGTIAPSAPGVSIQWQWAAAVYTSFRSDNNTLGVKPVDDTKASAYKNSDHAGTPENFKTLPESSKSNVVGGATGGGASNYTGSYSGTGSVGPCPRGE